MSLFHYISIPHIYLRDKGMTNKNNSSTHKKLIHSRSEVIPSQDTCRDMYAQLIKRNHPYDNCHKQLCKMESSSVAPSYENVAQFQAQQRKIAAELNKTENVPGKCSRCSNPSFGCCEHYRICHTRYPTPQADSSLTSYPSCEEHHTSLNKTIVAGQL